MKHVVWDGINGKALKARVAIYSFTQCNQGGHKREENKATF